MNILTTIILLLSTLLPLINAANMPPYQVKIGHKRLAKTEAANTPNTYTSTSTNNPSTAAKDPSADTADINPYSNQACKETEVRCLAAADNGLDGAVFKCIQGRWSMIQDCRAYERCVEKPVPHCTWASKMRGVGEENVDGENVGEEGKVE